MQGPPVQFDLPPASPVNVEEAPLPRLKWVWPAFIIFFSAIIILSLVRNDKKPAVSQDPKKLEEKTLEFQLCLKSLQKSFAINNANEKVPLFEPQVKDLLEPARKEAHAQKLRIVLQREDSQPVFRDDVRNLAKSPDKENQAFAKLYGETKLNKDEALGLLKQLDKNEISERIADVQIRESFGDKKIRSTIFDPSKVVPVMVIGVFYMFGLGVGTILWIYYYLQRQNGKLAPKGLPLQNLDWGRADRLLFVSLIVFSSYFLGGIFLAPFVKNGGGFEILMYLPIFISMFVCLKVPIYGWRIMPEKMGLSFKELPKHIGWAFGAFFANIPVLTLVGLVAGFLIRILPGGSHPVSEEILRDPKPMEIAKIFFLASVIAPIWEEFFFRGLLFPAFNKALAKPLQAALLSSFIFAAIHPQGAAGTPLLMGIALMLCAVSYQTKSLMSNIILHGLHNGTLLIFALYLAPLMR